VFEREVEAVLGRSDDMDDRIFREHLVFVFNQVIQNIRKTGWTKETLVKAGKLLFRLYKVFRAYQEKKKKYTLTGWMDKVIAIGTDINKTFSG
tara:strand:- start:19 stop:297 length:279 start_codon:yes stop_codon:yes gene_type:complete